ncbi:VWFA domain-containing protein [Entamoeba marina]
MSELDLVLVCDSTANMGCYLTTLKNNIKIIIENIFNKMNCDTRLSIIEYRDHQTYNNPFVFRLTDFTSDMKEINDAINKMYPYGGDDGPEAVSCAFQCATSLKFREKSTKLMFWIADAPPHGFCFNTKDNYPDGCPCQCDFIQIVHELAHKGVIVYPIGAEPLQFNHFRTLMRAVAEMTGGKYADLASAEDMSNFIINSSIEEIMINEIILKVIFIVSQSGKFLNMRNEDKIKLIKTVLNEEIDKKDIESAQLESIFKNRLDPIPDIYKTAQNMKELVEKVKKSKDIKVKFVSKFNGGSIQGLQYHLSVENGEEDYLLIKKKVVASSVKPENPLINYICPLRKGIKDPMKQSTKVIKRKANPEQVTRMETRLINHFQL